jgi:quercetin dioxygenase-like cupin family protein
MSQLSSNPVKTGTAETRARDLGDITLRTVAYSRGFKADHWCAKGHIVYVISGSLVIEHEDKTSTALSEGVSWHAPDNARPPHRVLCEASATVFIVD